MLLGIGEDGGAEEGEDALRRWFAAGAGDV